MARQPSRPKRWAAAVTDALSILEEIEDARARLEAALSDLDGVREEYAEWRDNIPENLQGSPLYEKLDAVADLDFSELLESLDVDTVRGTLEEADGAELPLGFGRD